MHFERTRKKSKSPDILPMIDVVFFLLVFFMIFTTIKTTPLGLDVELPKAVTGNPQDTSSFEILVDKNGLFYIGGKSVTGAELRQALDQRIKVNPDVFVVVKADKEVMYEHVVKALDHIRGVGGYKLGLAVEQDS
ncbi:MAG: biopolymer transporter ExbD [Bacillota bacterium]|nr:biopolymer transporter ExbD [Bacillota bacterium]HHU61700.1 biopolymer transporter ExbD [Natronincola sp.]